MSLHIDREFISRISSTLIDLTEKRNIWNSRCPMCGDSRKSKRKKRFYIFQKKGVTRVICHNCGYSQPFGKFIEEIDTELAKEYRIALFKDARPDSTSQNDLKTVVADEKKKRAYEGINYTGLVNFGALSANHPARQYVDRRKLPYDRVFYCPDFGRFVVGLDMLKPEIIEQFSKLNLPVMVIPFFIRKNYSRVFQIRTFDPNFVPKYITFKIDEEDPKIFGIDRITPHKLIYVVEGPIDSMCLDNSIAFSGLSSELPNNLKKMTKAFFYDNEPRNRDVVRMIHRKIKAGERVVLFENMPHKDVNDMYVAGLDVNTLFRENTVQGPVALMKFYKWKKV